MRQTARVAVLAIALTLTADSAMAAEDLKAPVPAGATLQVIHGYNDPPPSEPCNIGASPDHCGNQLYGLDLQPVGFDDTTIVAPASGRVSWSEVGGTGCIGLTLDAGLNLNLCHLGELDVDVGGGVTEWEVDSGGGTGRNAMAL
jgi:hypothetical protein